MATILASSQINLYKMFGFYRINRLLICKEQKRKDDLDVRNSRKCIKDSLFDLCAG